MFQLVAKTGFDMPRIGYAPGAFDLFHIGHLNILRESKSRCDFLIAGVVADDVLLAHKGIRSVVPLAERLEIVRNIRCVDSAVAATTNDKLQIWRELHFDILFKGDDWSGTEKAAGWSAISRLSASRLSIFRIPKRHRAAHCAGRCRTSMPLAAAATGSSQDGALRHFIPDGRRVSERTQLAA